MRLPLDHLGLLCRDLDNTVAGWRSLGFEVSDPVVLDPGNGSSQGRQRSAHVTFQHHYLELSCVTDARPEHPLYRWTGEPDAARILVLACTDAEAKRAAIKSQGFSVSPVHEARRAAGNGEARFRWFGLEGEPVPGTLTAWVQHLTPELVFAPAGHRHPNGVIGLRTLACRDTGPLEAFSDDEGPAVPCVAAHTAAGGDETVLGASLFGSVPEKCRERLLNENLATATGSEVLEIGPTLTGGLRLTLEAGP
jgi:hypothetical protein